MTTLISPIRAVESLRFSPLPRVAKDLKVVAVGNLIIAMGPRGQLYTNSKVLFGRYALSGWTTASWAPDLCVALTALKALKPEDAEALATRVATEALQNKNYWSLRSAFRVVQDKDPVTLDRVAVLGRWLTLTTHQQTTLKKDYSAPGYCKVRQEKSS